MHRPPIAATTTTAPAATGRAAAGSLAHVPPPALLATAARAAARGDALGALQAYAAAHTLADPAATPVLAAELARRLDRLALGVRPPTSPDRPSGDLAAPATRGWLDRALCLPPAVMLLVLARARWFLPTAGPADPRRMALAHALLDGLGRRQPPVDAHLYEFLLASRLIPPAAAPILGRGLAVYAAGDDLTALHLLVPGVEPLLWRLLRLAAGPAAGPPSPGSGTALDAPPMIGLASLLGRPALRRALGAGLVSQLRAVLLAGGREGLRHRLAHGRLPPAACTHAVTQDVILCYLRLSRRPLPLPVNPPRPGDPAAGRRSSSHDTGDSDEYSPDR